MSSEEPVHQDKEECRAACQRHDMLFETIQQRRTSHKTISGMNRLHLGSSLNEGPFLSPPK